MDPSQRLLVDDTYQEHRGPLCGSPDKEEEENTTFSVLSTRCHASVSANEHITLCDAQIKTQQLTGDILSVLLFIVI